MVLSVESLEPRCCLSVSIMMGPVSPYPTNNPALFSDTAVVDFELDQLYQTAINNNNLTATEIKSIILSTTDQDVIDRFEFLQLKRYVKNMISTDYVQYLSKSLVEGHESNTSNLQMWDSADKILLLVDKWFNGKDLPSGPHGTYMVIPGNLFVNDISPVDAQQGSLNDCYFITALGAIAQNSPDTIRSMFHEIDDNVWAVGFYDNYGKKHFVTVNNELPSNNRDSVFASFSNETADSENELWPALLEKAYVQVSQNKGFRSSNVNDYTNIEWGDSARAIYHITMQKMAIIKGDVKDKYIAYLNLNIPIVISYQNHTYTFESYSIENDKFFLRNPYQINHKTMTWEELKNINIVGSRQGGYVVNIV